MLNYYFLYLDIQLYHFMNHSDLYSLLPSLFDLFDYIPSSGIWNIVMKHCWNKCFGHLKESKENPQDYQIENLPTNLYNIRIKECLNTTQTATKFAFGILGGYVWKFKFEEKLDTSNFNKLSKEYYSRLNTKNCISSDKHEIIDTNENNLDNDLDSDELNSKNDEMNKKAYDLNLHLFSSDMGIIHELFQNAIKNATDYNFKEKVSLNNGSIRWQVDIDDEKLKLQVFKTAKDSNESSQDPTPTEDIKTEKIEDEIKNGDNLICTKDAKIEKIEDGIKNGDKLICTKDTKIEKIKGYFHEIIASSLLNDNDIVILTRIGLYIFHFSEYNESIYLNYFYSMKLISTND